MTRRGLLGVAVVAGTAMVGYAAAPAAAASSSLSAAQTAMVLRIAAAGAVYPIPFPAFGESGTALSRATGARLGTALRRVDAARLTRIRAGADALIAANAPDDAALRAAVGTLAATDRAPALTAAVALGIATVSRHFDPSSDSAARVWIGGLRNLHASAAEKSGGDR